MKKIIISICLVFSFFLHSYAYTPTDREEKLLNSIGYILKIKAKSKGESWINRQIGLFEQALGKVAFDERKEYFLIEILSELKSVKEELYSEKELSLKIETDENFKSRAKSFFYEHGSDITTNLDVSDVCTEHFDFIDEIAKKNNFPTELIIATWGIEYGCKLGNPANGWGPFQITSQFYEPGEITLEEFGNSIQKYIDFTRGKWDYFNNNSYHNYKERFGSENINITYDNYSIRDIKLTAILYNGVSKDTTLDGNTFANANLNTSVSHKSDGVVTRFLKVLRWRINNLED